MPYYDDTNYDDTNDNDNDNDDDNDNNNIVDIVEANIYKPEKVYMNKKQPILVEDIHFDSIEDLDIILLSANNNANIRY